MGKRRPGLHTPRLIKQSAWRQNLLAVWHAAGRAVTTALPMVTAVPTRWGFPGGASPVLPDLISEMLKRGIQ